MTAVTERVFRETLDALGLNPEKGAWDSIRHFNLVMELEARWGAKIPIQDVEKLQSFSDFYFRVPCRPAKVLAVDADNTLWDGIVSEDGAADVEPYAAFQRGLLALKAKGVVLVLLSKNDPPDGGRSPLEQALARADMPLSLNDFAFVGVSWEPKPGALLAAAKALNVGTDSFVFVDDNPHERAQMKAHLPEVMVVEEMESWQTKGMEGLAESLGDTYFAEAGRTEEDRLRAQRPVILSEPGLAEAAFVRGDYLKTLELKVSSSRAEEADVPRLAQMAGKTNQFNATTIRRNEEEFRALLADPSKRVYVFRLSDKFGAMGIVCFVVADVAACRITDFVMSCRAMGRTLEFFAYRHVCQDLGAETVPIDFSATAKNGPFAAFLEKLAHGERETFCM
jgi:FkbH-like protein